MRALTAARKQQGLRTTHQLRGYAAAASVRRDPELLHFVRQAHAETDDRIALVTCHERVGVVDVLLDARQKSRKGSLSQKGRSELSDIWALVAIAVCPYARDDFNVIQCGSSDCAATDIKTPSRAVKQHCGYEQSGPADMWKISRHNAVMSDLGGAEIVLSTGNRRNQTGPARVLLGAQMRGRTTTSKW